MYNQYNPYYNPNFRPYEQPYAQNNINVPQIQQNAQMIPKTSLQGKQVDSVDVVKATDIPMDGSISYFPLADNSAIVTKQLQGDGTSKIVVFKPSTEEKEEKIKYATMEDIESIKNNMDDLLDKFKEFKGECKEEFKEMRKTIKEK